MHTSEKAAILRSSLLKLRKLFHDRYDVKGNWAGNFIEITVTSSNPFEFCERQAIHATVDRVLTPALQGNKHWEWTLVQRGP